MEKIEMKIWEKIAEGRDSLETLYCNVEALTDNSDCMDYCLTDLSEDIETVEHMAEITAGHICLSNMYTRRGWLRADNRDIAKADECERLTANIDILELEIGRAEQCKP